MIDTSIIIALTLVVVFGLTYSILFVVRIIKDYDEANKAHKKMLDENDFYL